MIRMFNTNCKNIFLYIHNSKTYKILRVILEPIKAMLSANWVRSSTVSVNQLIKLTHVSLSEPTLKKYAPYHLETHVNVDKGITVRYGAEYRMTRKLFHRSFCKCNRYCIVTFERGKFHFLMDRSIFDGIWTFYCLWN